MKRIKIILLKLIITSLSIVNLNTQVPVITNEKQISYDVKNKLFEKSPIFNDFKNQVKISTTSLSNQIQQVNNNLQSQINDLSNSTITIQSQINTLSNSTITLQSQIDNLPNIFVSKTGDIITGNLEVQGLFGVGNSGIYNAGNATFMGNLGVKKSYSNTYAVDVDGDVNISGQYLINGQPLQAGDNLGNHIATTTLDMANNSIIQISSLSGNIFNIDGNSLSYKRSGDLSPILHINNTTGYVGIGTDNPVYSLDVNGTIRAEGLDFGSEGRINNVNYLVSNLQGGYDYLNEIRLDSALLIRHFVSYNQQSVKDNNIIMDTEGIIFNIDNNNVIKVYPHTTEITDLRVGSGSNEKVVYLCSGGDLDGILTTNYEQCDSSYIETKLYIKY